MASPDRRWRQLSFGAAVITPRLELWSLVKERELPESIHARVLLSDGAVAVARRRARLL
jgi:hypothetical protein